MMKGIPDLYSAWTIIPRFPLGDGHVAKDVKVHWYREIRMNPVAWYSNLIEDLNEFEWLQDLMYEKYEKYDDLPPRNEGEPVHRMIQEGVGGARLLAMAKVDEFFTRGELNALRMYLRDELGLPMESRNIDLPIPCVLLEEDGTLGSFDHDHTYELFGAMCTDQKKYEGWMYIVLSKHPTYRLSFEVEGWARPYKGKMMKYYNRRAPMQDHPLECCCY